MYYVHVDYTRCLHPCACAVRIIFIMFIVSWPSGRFDFEINYWCRRFVLEILGRQNVPFSAEEVEKWYKKRNFARERSQK